MRGNSEGSREFDRWRCLFERPHEHSSAVDPLFPRRLTMAGKRLRGLLRTRLAGAAAGGDRVLGQSPAVLRPTSRLGRSSATVQKAEKKKTRRRPIPHGHPELDALEPAS